MNNKDYFYALRDRPVPRQQIIHQRKKLNSYKNSTLFHLILIKSNSK